MTQHTQGPWTATYDQVKDDCGALIAQVYGGCAHENHDENAISKANARLIAAAPELLSAAKLLSEYSHNPNGYAEKHSIQSGEAYPMELLRAAIAKAEGGL